MNYYEYQFTRSVTETQVSKTDPSQILAGGAMRINGGALFNLDSQIIAGANLESQLTTLNNQASVGEQITTDIGLQSFWMSHEPRGANNDYTSIEYTSSYSPSPVVKTISLDTVRIEGNTSPIGSNTQITTLFINDINQNANGANAASINLQAGSNATEIGNLDYKQQLPNNSLFNVNPSPVSRYLVETSSQFTNYKQWLSSDYLLSKLATDPTVTQKRMGDGFYEQKLVREQVAQLTGQRFLTGYSNDEVEYRALMDNGLTFAQSHQLIPGIALSAAQMAQLTSDIVWLIAENVTLADGSVQSVLVPHVYAKLNVTDIDGNGTLLAGNSLSLNLTGDLNNSGTLAGRQVTAINAETINNLGGRITGNQAAVTAKTDLNNIGGQISANSQLAIDAGHDINLASTTRSSNNAQGSNTVLDRIAGLYVNGANGILSAKAGNDIHLMAAQINNGGSNGQSQLLAGRDLILGTVSTSNQNRVANNNGFWSESSQQENTSSIVTDGNLNLLATRDLTLQGATINNTQGDLLLNAGRALQLGVAEKSLQYAQSQAGNGVSVSSRVDAVNHLSTQLNSAGNISLQSGDNLNLISAQLNAGQDLAMIAGHNLNVSAAKDTQDYASSSRIKRRTDILQSQDERVISNNLNANGNISLIAQGGDLSLKTVNATADQGALSLAAQNNIEIGGTDESHSSYEEHYQKKSGFLSSKVTHSIAQSQSELAIGSNLSGNRVDISAGKDLGVIGSNLVADQAVNLIAGNDINLLAANNHSDQTTIVNSKKSGFLGGTGGAGFTIGSQTSKTTTHTVEDQTVASTIGSLQGDVTIQAGHHYQQTGSDVLATQGNVDILAQQVDITAADNRSQTTVDQKSQQTGLSISLSNPVVHAVETGINMAKAAKNTSNTRMQALAAANTGLAAYNAYNAVNEVANTPDGSSVGGYGVNFSLGYSENQSHSEQQQNTAQGSQLVAGQNLSIFATGNNTADSGDLNVIGSNLSAGQNLTLGAVNNILLQAAENQTSQQSRNSSLSASVGMTIAAGQQTGVSFNAGVNGSKGKANGEDISYSNTHVSAGNQVNLNSGQDTTLKGAVVSGQQIVANVGTSGQGNLNIESLQDQSRYSSDQKSGGVSVSVCLPPICAGAPVGGTVNFSKSNINSNYLSVTEQSGLKAGDGGFQIQVNGNTDLIGGLIASNNTAVDLGLNHLITETLTSRDLQNQAKYKANSLSISAGIGLNNGGPTGMLESSPSGMAGYGSDSDKANSTTFSAVSVGDLQITNDVAQQAKTDQSAEQTVAGLNRDTANTENAIKPIFDQQKVENEINAQVQITQLFGQQASKAVGDYAKEQLDMAKSLRIQAEDEYYPDKKAELLRDAAQMESDWGDQGTLRLAAHALIGGLTGNIEGAAGALVGAISAPEVAKLLQQAGIKGAIADTLTALASTAVGASVGNVSGASAAFNEVINNYLNHDETIKRIDLKKNKANGKCDDACEHELQALDELDKTRDIEIKGLFNLCQQSGTAANCEALAMHYAETNGYGFISEKFESNNRSGTPFSFNGKLQNQGQDDEYYEAPKIRQKDGSYKPDPGGLSYGPFQLSANTGGFEEFLKYLKKIELDDSAKQFYNELQAVGGLDGAKKGTKAFVNKFFELTKNDPQFVEYQFESINQIAIKKSIEPYLAELGYGFDDFNGMEKEAMFSLAVQNGGAGAKKIVDYIFSSEFLKKEIEYKEAVKDGVSLVSELYSLKDRKINLLEAEKNYSVDNREQISNINQLIASKNSEVDANRNLQKIIHDAINKVDGSNIFDSSEEFINKLYDRRILLRPSEIGRYTSERNLILKMIKERKMP
jgi:filamentous hemagglutinin